MKTKNKTLAFYKRPQWIASILVVIWAFTISAIAFDSPPVGCTPETCENPLQVDYTQQTVSVANLPTASGHVATKSYVDATVGAIDINDADNDPTNEIQTLSGVLATSNDANGFNISNLATPVSNTDASNKVYVDTAVSAASSAVGDIVCVPYGGATLSDATCPSIPGYLRFADDAACCWKKDEQSTEMKRIFVTSIGYTGNLGGETGADAKCQARADAANLDGTFKAWLLDGTNETYIYNKFADTMYSNILGQKVITTFLDYNSNLTGFSTLEEKIVYDEFGRAFTSSYLAWTNLGGSWQVYSSTTNNDNCLRFGSTSSAYSAVYGNVSGYTSSQWYTHATYACHNKLRLICVET